MANRREVLKGLGWGIGGALVGGGGVGALSRGRGTVDGRFMDKQTGIPSESASPSAPAEALEVRGDLIAVKGVPAHVDANTVDVAKGIFKNTIGNGTEGWLAEPGKLLVGPDFPQTTIDGAGGAIDRFNPVT